MNSLAKQNSAVPQPIPHMKSRGPNALTGYSREMVKLFLGMDVMILSCWGSHRKE